MLSKTLCSLLLLCLFVGLPGGLSGLELQRGKLKLVVNEKNGRYSLFGSEDQVNPTWVSLFTSDDPTTSKWKVQVGEKVHVLGDDPAFSTLVEASPTGATVVWTSKTLVVTMKLDFLLSASSTLADGLRLELSLVNVSEATAKVGVRWVLDTNLGEKKDHFRTALGETIGAETKIEGIFPDWWLSTVAADDPTGLVVMLGRGATTPSRVVFANWRRLDDTPWDFSIKAGRDFNQLPYSFNDSAVAQYYDAKDLLAGATREIIAMIGLKSAQSFEGSRVGSANPLDDLLKKGQDPALNAIDQDLVSLQTLLGQIDAKIADPTRITAEDLKLLRAVLDQFETRRKSLEVTKP